LLQDCEPRGRAAAVGPHRLHRWCEGITGGVRSVVEDVGVELAPAQLAAEGLVGPRAPELGKELAVQLAPAVAGRPSEAPLDPSTTGLVSLIGRLRGGA
jgi:hypothetical protein